MGAPSKSFTLRNNTAEEQRRAGLWAAVGAWPTPKTTRTKTSPNSCARWA